MAGHGFDLHSNSASSDEKTELVDFNALLCSRFFDESDVQSRLVQLENLLDRDHALTAKFGLIEGQGNDSFARTEQSTECIRTLGEKEDLSLVHKKSPPRYAVDSEMASLNSLSGENATLKIEVQPPNEVRTRTKNENRSFSCCVRVKDEKYLKNNDHLIMRVRMCYATNTSAIIDTLGGTLSKPVVNELVHFDDLSVSVASPKHSEREFALEIRLDGHDMCVYSTPFYAYSHRSVLKRRREVSLRALSHSVLSVKEPRTVLHVVGSPFVSSDRFNCVFRLLSSDFIRSTHGSNSSRVTADYGDWLSLPVLNMEVFSESALFFSIPNELRELRSDLQIFVQVTNDGRSFSNPLPLLLKSSLATGVHKNGAVCNWPNEAKRHCIRSRI